MKKFTLGDDWIPKKLGRTGLLVNTLIGLKPCFHNSVEKEN